MGNDVRIQVHWDDPDGAKFQAAQKAKAKKAGESAGDAFSGAFTGKSGRAGEESAKALQQGFDRQTRSRPITVPVKADNPIDAAWRKQIEVSIRATAGAALKIPAKPDTDLFRQDLEASLKKASALLKTEIPVKTEDAAKFRVRLETMVAAAEAGVTARIPVEVDEEKARQKGRKAGQAVEQELNKVAQRTQTTFEGLLFAALSAGLPAAAAAGAAGTAVALGGVPTLFMAIGAAALASNEQVASAWGDLGAQIQGDTQAIAGQFDSLAVEAAGRLGKTWQGITPQVAAAMNLSSTYVDDFADTVDGVARNAMPGMLSAVKSAGPAVQGFGSLATQASSGVSDMLENMSRGSADAGAGMETLGGTVRNLLGFVGNLTTNLAANHGELGTLDAMLNQVEQGLLSLTSAGSGAIGFLHGFGTAGLGTLTALNGLASLVSSLPQEITQFGGSVTASGLILSKFGIDATAGFDGLGEKIKKADGVGGKLKATVSGLASGALNPAALATVGLSLVLDELGEAQRRAAARAQAHQQAVDNLTSAMQQDGGVIGAATNATVAKALADENAANNLSLIGINSGVASAAILGNARAYDWIKSSADGRIAQMGKESGLNDQQIKNLQGMSHTLLETGGSYDDVRDKVENMGKQQVAAGRAGTLSVGELTDAQKQWLDGVFNGVGTVGKQVKAFKEQQEAERQLKAITTGLTVDQLKLNEASSQGQAAAANLASAFGTLAKAGGDVQSKGAALMQVFDSIHGSMQTAEDAQQAWNDQMRQAGELLKDMNLPVHNKDFLDAAGAINTTSEAGSKLQDFVQQGAVHMAAYAQALHEQGKSAEEVTAALEPMHTQLANQLKAWGLNDAQVQQVLEHYGAIPSEITTVLKISGGEQSQIQVQGIIEELLKMPAEKGVKVSTLTADARKNLEDLGYQVVALPDGTFQVFADTAPGRDAATQLQSEINHYVGTVTVHANTGDAIGSVNVWQKRTDGTYGTTTTDTRIDPATGKVQTWLAMADGTYAWTTTDSRIDPATGKVQLWVQQTNGKWAWVNADARTGAAESALNNAARTRTAVIRGVYIAPSTSGLGAAANRLAKGGTVGYATGGQIMSVPRFADGGNMLDIRNGGVMQGPGTGTSDSILAMSSRGPIAGSTGEMVIRASQTRKWWPLLEAINNGVNGFAGGGFTGGPVRHGTVSQSTWDSLLAAGWRGNPNDGMEALYAPASSSSGAGRGEWIRSAGSVHGGSAPTQFELVVRTGGAGDFERMFAEMIRRYVKVNGGGNVQTAFGQR